MSSEQKSAIEAKELSSANVSGAKRTTEPRMVRGTKSEKTRHFCIVPMYIEKTLEVSVIRILYCLIMAKLIV